MFAHLASINWLFNEGFYLHSKLTVNIFNTSDAPFKLFHALGWGKIQITTYISYIYKPLIRKPVFIHLLLTTIQIEFHKNINSNDN